MPSDPLESPRADDRLDDPSPAVIPTWGITSEVLVAQK
jgi:hypothetical protein